MAHGRFAIGPRAKAQCQRCGQVGLRNEMIPDGQYPGLLVHATSCYEPKHPQETPVRVDDAIAIRKPAPLIDRIPMQIKLPVKNLFGEQDFFHVMVVKDGRAEAFITAQNVTINGEQVDVAQGMAEAFAAAMPTATGVGLEVTQGDAVGNITANSALIDGVGLEIAKGDAVGNITANSAIIDGVGLEVSKGAVTTEQVAETTATGVGLEVSKGDAVGNITANSAIIDGVALDVSQGSAVGEAISEFNATGVGLEVSKGDAVGNITANSALVDGVGLQADKGNVTVTVVVPHTYLLDEIANADMALSFDLVREAYAGDCLRVRRSSDNAEQDIGFVDDRIDVASMESFCGAGDGFVVTWYNQVASAPDFTQATAGSQPKIVDSGTFLGWMEESGQSFTDQNGLISTASITDYGAGDFSAAAGFGGLSGFNSLAIMSDTSSHAAVNSFALYRSGTTTCSIRNNDGSSSVFNAISFFSTGTDFRHAVATRTGSSGEIFKDGVSFDTGTLRSGDVGSTSNWAVCRVTCKQVYAFAFSRVLTSNEIELIANTETLPA